MRLPAILAILSLTSCTHHAVAPARRPDAGPRIAATADGGAGDGGSTGKTSGPARSRTVTLVRLDPGEAGRAEDVVTIGRRTTRFEETRSASGLEQRSAHPGKTGWREGDLVYRFDHGSCDAMVGAKAAKAFQALGPGGLPPGPDDLVSRTLRIPRSALHRIGGATLDGTRVTRFSFDQRTHAALGTIEVKGRVALDPQGRPVASQGAGGFVGRAVVAPPPTVRWRFRLRALGRSTRLRLPAKCRTAQATLKLLQTVPRPPHSLHSVIRSDHETFIYETGTPMLEGWYQRHLPAAGWKVHDAGDGETDALVIRRGRTRVLVVFLDTGLNPMAGPTSVTISLDR